MYNNSSISIVKHHLSLQYFNNNSSIHLEPKLESLKDLTSKVNGVNNYKP